MVILRNALLASLFAGSALGAAPSEIELLADAFGEDQAPLRVGIQARVAHLAGATAASATDRVLAQETLTLVAPLAERVGLGVHRGALEDASLRILDPSAYASFAEPDRSADLQHAVAAAEEVLEALGAPGLVTARVKSRYSTLQKMSRKGVDRAEITDRLGVRLRVEETATCFRVVDALHQRFRPIAGTYDDYISTPKANGYASLHTAVTVPGVGPVEFQVRTHAMHAAAEGGDAAHWRYKA